MALLREDDDDDFFGNDDYDEKDGLAAAEAVAMRERYFQHGFHETFEATEEATLQEGFEQGYKESFEAAKRIGWMIGKLTFEHNKDRQAAAAAATSPSQQSSSSNNSNNPPPSSSLTHAALPPYLAAAKVTRDFLTISDVATTGDYDSESTEQFLEPLETRVQQIMMMTTTMSEPSRSTSE